MGKLKVLIFSLLMSMSVFSMERVAVEQKYTVNFEDVELNEVLRFVSRIGNLNLIYNESDVTGTVTFVSDEPTSLTNIKSALIQILRIRGLSLIEEGNNLIIHRNPEVKQMPVVVSAKHPVTGQMPAIMTRVFDIKRGNPTNIASILTPLLSASAQIEVSIDTMQIIVTDVASSIQTIDQLLDSLDTPETPFRVKTYQSKNMGVLEMQIFAQKIMAPLSTNTVLEIVAQPDINTIFIVSTPFLIDRTIAVLNEIDKEVTLGTGRNHKLTTSNVLIYQLKHKNREIAIATLYNIIKESNKQKIGTQGLKNLVDRANFLKSNNSLVFVGMPVNLALLQGLLNSIDTPGTFSGSEEATFVLFEPETMSVNDLLKILEEIAENLESSDYPNKHLLNSIAGASAMYELNSILLITTPKEKAELMTLLQSILASYNEDTKRSGISHFYLYNIQNSTEEQMRDSLCCLQEHLRSNQYPNHNLLTAICSMQWIRASNSLFFVGSSKALEELATILPSFDIGTEHAREVLTQSAPATEFVVYTPKMTGSEDLKKMVIETCEKLCESDLSDPAFMNTIKSIQILPSTDQLIFTGGQESLDRLMILLNKLDTARNMIEANEEIYLYSINHLSYEEIEKLLNDIATHTAAIEQNPESLLLLTIKKMRYIADTNSIQFVGTKEVIGKIQALLGDIDSPNNKNSLDNSLLVYKPRTMGPKEIITHLKSIVKTTQKGKTKPTDLYYAVQSVKYVKQSGNLIFVGTKSALNKIKALLGDIDAAANATTANPNRHVEGYQIYVPQHVGGPELISMVTSFESHLVNSGMTNEPLSEVVDHLTYVQKTNTIIISGEKSAVEEVISLLKQFDNHETPTISTSDSIDDYENQGFLVYKIQNVDGQGVVASLKKVASSLQSAAAGNEKAQEKNRELVNSINTIQWIENTNSLIASGPPKVLTRLEQLLKSVDRPVRQVFIEVLVIDSSVTDNNTFGLSWQNKGTIYQKFGYSLANLAPQSDSPAIPFAKNTNQINETTSASGSAIPPLAGGSLGIIGDIIFHNGKSYSSIGSLLNALKASGNTTVVLAQKIVAQDNKNTKLFSGDNVPFTGSLVTTSGLSQTSNANLEYRNIGVTLSITPSISSDGMITLEVDQEISEEVNTGDDSSSSNVDNRMINGIRTSQTNMTTTIRVPDRHFLILSGTMKNTSSRSVAGIPCLGGLPLIGAAFNHTEKTVDNHNVIMFVKPHIIEDIQSYKDITNTQENIFSEKSQCHEDDFADGLETVQSPYDISEFEEGTYDFDDDDFEAI